MPKGLFKDSDVAIYLTNILNTYSASDLKMKPNDFKIAIAAMKSYIQLFVLGE